MQVKIGDKLYTAADSGPIMLILSPADKHNLKNMDDADSRYAIFPDTDSWRDSGDRLAWMQEDISKTIGVIT